MKSTILRASILALTCLPLAAQAAEQEKLQTIGMRALRAVEEHLGVKLKKELEFRPSKKAELREILVRELTPQFEAQLEDKDEAAQQCKTYARNLAPALMAKYEFGTGNVLVAQKSIDNLADMIEEPKLKESGTLQAILVHECVHVLADQEYAFVEKLNKLDSTDKILAYNAVLEGHAQYIARQVCKKHGWSEGFDVFTRAIGKVPESDDESENLRRRVMAVTLSWAYYQGEEFIAAMDKHSGEKGIRRAYVDPPSSQPEIFHPEWYIDPTTRPKIEYSIDRAFDLYEKDIDKDDWQVIRTDVNRAQLEAALGLLDKADLKRSMDHLHECKSMAVQWKSPPGEHLIALAAFVCDSTAEAAFLLACEEQVLRKKDEKMATGAVSILDATYKRKSEGAIHGLYAVKTIKFRGNEFAVSTIVLTMEQVVIELLYSNHEITEEEAMKQGVAMITAMMPQTKKKKDGDKK